MANNNCLKGMACPECKQDDRINVAYTATTTVYDDGTEESGWHSGMEWGDDSVADCPECSFSGYWSDFYKDEDTDREILSVHAMTDRDGRPKMIGISPINGVRYGQSVYVRRAPATKRNVAIFNRAMTDDWETLVNLFEPKLTPANSPL